LGLVVKRVWLRWVMAANLVMIVSLTFLYPHLMVSPGALSPGHAGLATDCFACHAPWHGATSQRCIACHPLPDIGWRTTKGAVLAKSGIRTAFHQQLTQQDCMACHSDHASPKLTQIIRKPFAHSMLRIEVQQRCESCHAKSVDPMHPQLTVGCAKCHSTQGWKPTTFDHAKRFVLDRDHDTQCVTCHASHDFRRYTCYGCHEHTPEKIRAEHQEEGIRDFEKCVDCHRDPRAEPQRGGAKDDEKSERD